MKTADTTAARPLRVVSVQRATGIGDAIRELGTHKWVGRDVFYTYMQVRLVLMGKGTSKTLMRRIAERRPDFFDLYFVREDVRTEGKELVRQLSRKTRKERTA